MLRHHKILRFIIPKTVEKVHHFLYLYIKLRCLFFTVGGTQDFEKKVRIKHNILCDIWDKRGVFPGKKGMRNKKTPC
jgi:hypothetical protein